MPTSIWRTRRRLPRLTRSLARSTRCTSRPSRREESKPRLSKRETSFTSIQTGCFPCRVSPERGRNRRADLAEDGEDEEDEEDEEAVAADAGAVVGEAGAVAEEVGADLGVGAGVAVGVAAEDADVDGGDINRPRTVDGCIVLAVNSERKHCVYSYAGLLLYRTCSSPLVSFCPSCLPFLSPVRATTCICISSTFKTESFTP